MKRSKPKKSRRSLSKMPNKYPDICARFRETIKDKGLTTKQIAEIFSTPEITVNESTIKAIVHSDITPNIHIIRMWSLRLNKSLKWIFFGD